ncbi:MAG TPA: hypothetical protein DHV62_07300, partial [Elusimicrobia bacterium]|nr:hypothetical protein [Elusimicrobiota bacterium]
MEYGDIYYDFAKLNHGLIISHELIKNDFYSVERRPEEINFTFLRKNSLVDCENFFRGFIIENKFDYKKV